MKHIQANISRIWPTQPGRIAEHVMALPKGTVPGSAET